MKTVMIVALTLATALLLTGCGHYGMNRHYNGNWHNQTNPGSWNMRGNSINTHGENMNEEGTQNQGIYMNGNSMQSQGGYGR